ncbi:MAG: GNAT family N-acetyltransferase [Rhizobiaceae bacterium]|nr:GNAT family N-acetyltransferase [Rhizobiaceae bacterium]
MSHLLDRPIWSALKGRHAALGEGNDRAVRYAPDVHPFACARDDEPESLAALAALIGPGETQIFLQAGEFVAPPEVTVTATMGGVQMVAERHVPQVADERIRKLADADAADMLELATLTKPGPFTMRALALGNFWGIRQNGQLIAMSGERLKVEGMTEVSGVCTHPDFRGRGLGKLMTLYAAGQVAARGETPFLHTYASNAAAIGLYEKIGFRLRSHMSVAVVTRQG